MDAAVHKFVTVFFKSGPVKVNYITDVNKAFADIFANGDLKTTEYILKAWREEAATRSKTGAFRENPYVFEKPIDLHVVKPNVDLNSRGVNNVSNIPFEEMFSQAANGFCFLAALLTIADSVNSFNKEMTSDNDFVNVMLHPATQILGAGLDIGSAVIGMQQNSMALNLKGKIVGEWLDKITAGAIDTTAKSGLSKVGIAIVGSAALATILIAGASLIDSVDKKDRAGIIGNSMWLASPMLITTAMYNLGKERVVLTLAGMALPWAWVNIFGYILLFAGFVVLFFQRNDLQNWVRDGFWGTNEDILDDEERPKKASFMIECYVNYNTEDHFNFIKDYQDNFYDKDVTRLYQLSSYIKLEDDIKLDGKVGVVSNLIYEEKSLDRFSILLEVADAPVGDMMEFRQVVEGGAFLEYLDKDKAYLKVDKEVCKKVARFAGNRRIYVRVKLFYKDVNFSNTSEWLSLALSDV